MFFAAAWALTPAFAQAMGDPDAIDTVRLMLVCVPLNGLVATPAALLQRAYQQGRRTVADQVNIWLGAGISVVLAVFGWGAMSLAIGRVVAYCVFAGMLIVFSPDPLRFGWNPAVVAPLLRFGLPLAGASIVVFAVERSQNSTHPSRPMPLSKELKSSLPCPAPEREHELSAVFAEISPGAPRGYSM